MRNCYLPLPLLLLGTAALAQTPGSVGIGTSAPDPKAALDISSTDKGLLIPRLTQAQRLALTGAPQGLMVFQTDGAAPGFWYYFGGQWLQLPSAQQAGVTASNGLSKTGADVQLGGALTQATTVAAGSQTLTVTSSPGTLNTATLVPDAGVTAAATGSVLMGSSSWQSFTVQQSGALKQVSLSLSPQSTATSGTLRVDVVGPLPATTVMAQATTPFFGAGPVSFSLNIPLQVFAGQQYQLRFTRVTGTGSVLVSYADGDPYAGGESTAGTGRDLLFGAQLYLPAADANVLTVQSGRLGVGTSAPQVPLHVAGATRFDALAGSGARVVTVDAAGNLGAGPTPSGQGDNLGNHAASQNLALNGNWLSNDGSAEGLHIDNSGNVGLGTATPNARLDLGSGALMLGAAIGNNDTRPTVGTARLAGEISAYGSAGGSTPTATADDGYLRLSAGGGSSANTKSFIDLAGYSQQSDVDKTIRLGTAGAERLRVLSNGNVGIGRTDPQQQLHVAGNIAADGPLGVVLANADRPLITRAWDAFTSGTYSGIGRWGLFMEPNALTFGVPAIASKRFQWVTYSPNSTVGSTLMTLTQDGQLQVSNGVSLPATESYAYNSAKTYYHTLSAQDFRSSDPAAYEPFTVTTNGTPGVFYSVLVPGSGTATLVAPVHLPQGATVTNLRLLAYRDNAGAIPLAAKLVGISAQAGSGAISRTISPTASITTDNPSIVQGADTGVSITIDNTAYTYYVQVDMNRTGGGQQLVNVRLTYTVTQAE